MNEILKFIEIVLIVCLCISLFVAPPVIFKKLLGDEDCWDFDVITALWYIFLAYTVAILGIFFM